MTIEIKVCDHTTLHPATHARLIELFAILETKMIIEKKMMILILMSMMMMMMMIVWARRNKTEKQLHSKT
jgi:hypothetical protein